MQAVKSLEGQGYTVQKEYPITRHVSRQFPHEMTTGRKRKRSEVVVTYFIIVLCFNTAGVVRRPTEHEPS